VNAADTIRALHDALLKQAANRDKVVDLGFQAFRSVMLPAASANETDAARVAYMNGAQHLFASIMSIMDADEEPTPADLGRMSLIADELEAFTAEMKLRVAPIGGSA
jgi:hypothetical protein